MQDEETIAVEFEDDALADSPYCADDFAVNGLDRWVDRSEDERAQKIDTLEAVADDVPRQRLEVDDDVREFRQLFLQPVDDLLARPVMIVVQVQDDGVERQPLVAALGTAAADVLEAVEQPIETRPDGVRFLGIARQRICAFVRRAKRAGSTFGREVLAKGLGRAPLCAFSNRLGELELISAGNLMHGVSLAR
jgi:hypothetical protein